MEKIMRLSQTQKSCLILVPKSKGAWSRLKTGHGKAFTKQTAQSLIDKGLIASHKLMGGTLVLEYLTMEARVLVEGWE
jgi:hypothetical protein